MKKLVAIVAAFCLSVPAAYAVPPAGKGKPEKPAKALAANGSSAEKNAAKKCKAERARMGVDAFREEYGTNANGANAFGKCVAEHAKGQRGSSS